MSIKNSKNFYQKLTQTNNKHQTLSIWWCPVFLLPWIVFFVIVLVIYNSLPTPILQKDEHNHPLRFIGERAQNFNRNITNIGPKVVGSDLNEVIAVDLLRNQILEIINNRNPIHNIDLDIQVASGSFQLFTMITVYQNIQNVVVKLSSADAEPADSLLLSTHFDSVPISPGGGDSCTFTAVMMETLRVMSQNPTTFRHSIVFLFNGAEENGLHGSHAFITQHKWASSVRAFINMDAAGNGGKEVLFQTTPGNQWMMNYYSQNAPHPLSAALGEELFQSNLVPSDTDIRIYRDFGNISGMDFAVYRNGYVYHTRYDVAETISMGSFQNAGDNILAITKAIADSSKLPQSHARIEEKLVFFDFLGAFIITYTTTVAIAINLIISLLALVAIVFSLRSFKNNLDLKVFHITWEFVIVFLIQIISIVIAVGVLILLAIIFDATSNSMSWYSSKWLIFGLYYCPLIFVLGMGPATYLSFRKRNAISLSCYIQMFLHAQCLIYVILMLMLTASKIRSAYVLLFALTFYTLTTFINLFSRLQLRDCGWILVHFIGQIIPFFFYAYYAIYVLDGFIPIQGRSGPTSNPEIFIIIVVAATGLLLSGQLIPTLCIFRRPLLLMCGFLLLFLIFVMIMLTPVGFPYKETVSPQRFWIFHTERQFHNFDKSIKSENSGYFMLPMDRHSNNLVNDIIPQFSTKWNTSSECDSEMFCGSPLYMSRMIAQSYHSTWIPSSKPDFPMRTTLELRATETIDNSTQTFRLKFMLTGPDRTTIYITTRNGSNITDWSFSTKLPTIVSQFQSAPLYFIYIGHGKVNMEYEFFIDVQKANIHQPSIALTTVGHYTHHDEYRTKEFENFLNSFPKWAHVTPWMCSYNSYYF